MTNYQVFWQAKIWGLLHDPVLKALHNNSGRGKNSLWSQLAVMQDWTDNNYNPEKSTKTFFTHIKLADYITSASDRSAIGSLNTSINYGEQGLEIRHLLSGEPLNFRLSDPAHQQLISDRTNFLNQQESQLFDLPIKDNQGNQIKIKDLPPTEIKKLYWWLWRCLPVATCQAFGKDDLLLMPAETRIPDSSIWSHVSLTSAMAGALAGRDLTPEDIQKNWDAQKKLSRPYLTSFSFSPIQELIKASRKMRDFWSGSWILHYLSAKVCWKLANIYGPDSFIYPCLFQQPLIDYWLRQEYPDFDPWVLAVTPEKLMTAGFPNVIVLILPEGEVKKATQTAKQTLLEEWQNLADLSFDFLTKEKQWMQKLDTEKWPEPLKRESKSWQNWLTHQWQTYWASFPLGDISQPLSSSELYQADQIESATKEPENQLEQSWILSQNQLCQLVENEQLFLEAERDFLKRTGKIRKEQQNRNPPNINIGSWWPHISYRTGSVLSACKSARTWKIPTAFGPRSTISGLGPVVHPDLVNDWITEKKNKDLKELWAKQIGLFDGVEQLNATEIVKRCLYKILPKLFPDFSDEKEKQLLGHYPDLTAGVAGYLKVNPNHRANFNDACKTILEVFNKTCKTIQDDFDWEKNVIGEMANKWGIPLEDKKPQKYHPRLLNVGWLIEDSPANDPEAKKDLRKEIEPIITEFYPNNNPADWYVLAAGDGDGMSEWLKGNKLDNYEDYVASELRSPEKLDQLDQMDAGLKNAFQRFLEQKKRMGPSTHSALSRALLDFSNVLVPYLTEQRYAGRLIYGGGDDVLAYTNLWEWDNWLWDIRQCFRGDEDPQDEFKNDGDYWQKREGKAANVFNRPLFTMGSQATISFGITIAHHSVPLAIALENLWEAEAGAKAHECKNVKAKDHEDKILKKDAVQVRVLYGNGNILKATTKFEVFNQWRELIEAFPDIEPAIFEQAATIWEQHPAPVEAAIEYWANAFCQRREKLIDDQDGQFQKLLTNFIKNLWQLTPDQQLNEQVKNWLKLAAFILRQRHIQIPDQSIKEVIL
jgi:CRISPR-associated protein Cmr2